MKRWIPLTLLLYLLSLTVLTLPLLKLLDLGWGEIGEFSLFFVSVLVLIQLVLLLVPMDVARARPVKQRKVVASAIMGAIPMAVLGILFIISIDLMIFGEDSPHDLLNEWSIYSILGLSWLVWGIVFYKSYTAKDPRAFISCITRWLLRGSILEMMVAIPSHIISRQREECCAPYITLFGIATGIAVALMSFGPGILFLFAQKIKSKKSK